MQLAGALLQAGDPERALTYARAAREELESSGARCRAYPLDVTDDGAIAEVRERLIRDAGSGTEADRMESAFQGVPRDRWAVFRDGGDLAGRGLFPEGE